MLDAAREAIELAKGRTAAEIQQDRLRQLSIGRLLEVIGEAAAQAPAEVRQRYANIL